MVSNEFLELLDRIEKRRNFEEYELDHLLSEFNYGWGYLQSRYRTYKQNSGTYTENILHELFEQAEIAYEMLYILLQHRISFSNIIHSAKELHKTKNAGYSGDSNDPWLNFRECEHFGITTLDGCLTRLSDKYRRFITVYGNNSLDQVNESAIDTLLDFAAYCLIAYCLLKEEHVS